MSTYDLAVVGGGPGGLAAAMYAAMRGMSVVAFEAETFGRTADHPLSEQAGDQLPRPGPHPFW